jgi:hypothetical protein
MPLGGLDMGTDTKTVSIYAVEVGDVFPGGAVVEEVRRTDTAGAKYYGATIAGQYLRFDTWSRILGPTIEVQRPEPLKPFRAEVCRLSMNDDACGVIHVKYPPGTPVVVIPLPLPDEVRKALAWVEGHADSADVETLCAFLRALEVE